MLTEVGLSENEACVYLAALSRSPATILQIARAAGIKRTTVYAVIESLKQKGLISIELKGVKQRFIAEDPAKLEEVLETRKEKFKKLLPEFSVLYKLKSDEGVVKYYEGLSSIKNIYARLLSDVRRGEEYMAISNASQWKSLDEKWFGRFMEKRAKLPIRVRLLLQDSDEVRKYRTFSRNYHFDVRLLPKNTSLSTTITITPRMVVLHQIVPPVVAISIENQNIISAHRDMFEIMWNAMNTE